MNLRLRLIVAFFLLSVVPLGAVTFYGYISNAAAIRDAAGREAELLAGDLTERMTLVTAQLSHQFEQLIDIPASARLQPTAVSAAAKNAPATTGTTVKLPTAVGAAVQATVDAATAKAEEASRLASQLGEVAMLLNNIEVRGFGRGRGRSGGGPPPGATPTGDPSRGRGAPFTTTPQPPTASPSTVTDGAPGQTGLPSIQAGGRRSDVPPLLGSTPSGAPTIGPSPSTPAPATATGSPEDRSRQARAGDGSDVPPLRRRFDNGDGASGRSGSGPGDGARRGGRDDQAGTAGGDRGAAGPPPEQPADPTRIQIDLGPMRREMLQQIFPDREQWDQLSLQERELILTKVNERMLGIQQGIQILQQKASEQAADAKSAAATAIESEPHQPAAATATSAPTPAPTPAAAPKRATRATSPASAPGATPTASATGSPANGAPPSLQRKTALSGSRMDVSVMQNGEVVGQVNAEINLPNLLATVFTTTRRDKGEVPFAVDQRGDIYTPTAADRSVISTLNTPASQPRTPPGTVLLPNWVVVTTADPTGSGLKFGIARPLGDALDDLRRSAARSAALGLGLIGLALIGIVPLSGHLTRNLSRLSDGVNRIAQGDYGTRVDVSSKDEIGRLAGAFNRMAADVERHQRSAVEQERLHRELELGRQIQHDMLPQVPFRLGLTEIRGVSVPASEVGGDFFNYFQTSSGAIALVVGDVSGKGVGAALLMANIQASLRTRLALGQELAALARELDADIAASTPGAVYATLFVGLLDPQSRILAYVNAGHNPQFVLRAAGGLERMASTGLPIGLLVGHGYEERRIALAAGDVLFFYTDGCVEADNDSGEMFGTARLEQLLAVRPSGSADDMLVRIEHELVQFRSGREPFDDATMMVVNVG